MLKYFDELLGTAILDLPNKMNGLIQLKHLFLQNTIDSEVLSISIQYSL